MGHSTLRSAWNVAKKRHTLRLGPVSVVFHLSASVPVSGNRSRRIRRAWSMWWNSSRVGDAPGPTPHPIPERRPSDDVAVVVGVGAGLGRAIVQRLARDGMRVAMLSRNAERLQDLESIVRSETSGVAVAYGCDATREHMVRDVMTLIRRDLGTPDLAVYCVEGFHPGQSLDVEISAFEESWRNTCLGAFLVAREAARAMVTRGHGTIIFMGASSSVFGRPGYLNLAVGKFGVRGMAQVMAKELAPKGIHVAHILIDGGIAEPGTPPPEGRSLLDPNALAEIVRGLHAQPRGTWTHELDVRSGDELWWQRC